ncbi:TioE family transcriptional regulator [Streptomyces sp. JB150]|uniref:TioE family transcriptional regulator n=1 Tax=Streptomyces sp. JB150 TaxID=2714844 RepID=UPI00140E262E|nr:TioE family transcriptional regulator [Streptomyces sp. JB150]QIJ64080.1 MerR family transcriptional regulator [Streptomyces sp. JB150]
MRESKRLRPVDLARLAGVSAQQIRNYEDAGVLPPAERTESGYRVFAPVHREALLAYRALSKGYGTTGAARIMQTVHAGDVPGALALVDAAHAALHAERATLEAAREALETLETLETPAERKPAGPPHGGLRVGEVAALLGVRPSALRVWEAAGLIVPERERGTGYRLYRPVDVRDARLVHTLRRGHHPIDRIRPVLEGLRREGSTEALRAAVAARGETLTARTRAMLRGAGRLHDYLDCLDRLDQLDQLDGPDPLGAAGTSTGDRRAGR